VTVTANFNYYYLTGALGVVFALVISILGLTHSKFPGKRMPLLMVLSVLLFVAGIVGAALGAKYKSGERHGPPAGSESVAGHKGG
jgi:hypothetical protein